MKKFLFAGLMLLIAVTAFTQQVIESSVPRGNEVITAMADAAGGTSAISLNGGATVDSSMVFHNMYRYVWISGTITGTAPAFTIRIMAGDNYTGAMVAQADSISVTSAGYFSALLPRQGMRHAYLVYKAESGNDTDTMIDGLVIHRIK